MKHTLRTLLAPQFLLNHPFYQKWNDGTLSRDCLKNYAKQYQAHVDAFPRYVSAVHSQCLNDEDRKALAWNLMDEEGLPNGTPHPTLWRQFAQALGAESAPTQLNPAAQALCDGFEKLTQSSYAAGLGALYAYEYQVPEIAETKIRGLTENYSVTNPEALEFFQVHQKADVYHTETLDVALNRLSPSERAIAETSAQEAGQLLWNFLTEALDYNEGTQQ